MKNALVFNRLLTSRAPRAGGIARNPAVCASELLDLQHGLSFPVIASAAGQIGKVRISAFEPGNVDYFII
jgi:hypothetical protein